MEAEITPIAHDQHFQFGCHASVPCFNACCRDLNQFLTPYDILQLKSHLGLDAGTFLEHYTQSHIGPATGLPIVTLKPGPGDDHPCPFVTPQGCAVYPARPASCRVYPLMRGVQRDPQSGALRAHFALLREPHCRGFEQGARHTPEQWITHQGLTSYNTMNDRLAGIIAMKSAHQTGPLDLGQGHLFRLALYDLDSFQDQVFNKGLLKDTPIANHLLEAARQDQAALLELAFTWIEKFLFQA